MATGWSTCRARNWRRRSGATSARPPASRARCRPNCPLGRSCASAVPHSRPRRSRMRCGRGRSRRTKTCFSPATGLLRGCLQPSRDRCGRATAPPIWFWPGKFQPNKAPDRKREAGFAIEPGAKTGYVSNMHSANPAAANPAAIEPAALDASIASATEALLGYRQADGHWVFELEADATIPSEYVLLRHYLAEPVDAALEAKIANYLRRVQGDHGGWPLVQDGAFDMSASVKSYFALKMIGDPTDSPHMVRAREAILARGGAINSNV